MHLIVGPRMCVYLSQQKQGQPACASAVGPADTLRTEGRSDFLALRGETEVVGNRVVQGTVLTRI